MEGKRVQRQRCGTNECWYWYKLYTDSFRCLIHKEAESTWDPAWILSCDFELADAAISHDSCQLEASGPRVKSLVAFKPLINYIPNHHSSHVNGPCGMLATSAQHHRSHYSMINNIGIKWCETTLLWCSTRQWLWIRVCDYPKSEQKSDRLNSMNTNHHIYKREMSHTARHLSTKSLQPQESSPFCNNPPINPIKARQKVSRKSYDDHSFQNSRAM